MATALATTPAAAALRGGGKQLGSAQPKSPLEAAGSATVAAAHGDHHRSGEPWSLRELDHGHSYTSTGAATNSFPRLQGPAQGRKSSIGHPSNVAQVHDVNLTDFLESKVRTHSKHHPAEPIARTSSKQDAGAELARTKDVQAALPADMRQPYLPPKETATAHGGNDHIEPHHERRMSGSKEAHKEIDHSHNRTLTAAEAQEKNNSVMQWFRASHEINERMHNPEETEHIIEDARKRRAAYGHQRSGSHLDGTQAPTALGGLAPGTGPPVRPARRFINVRKKGTEGPEPEHEEVTETAEVKPAAAIYDAVALWGAKPIKPEAPKPKEEVPKKTGCIFEGVKVGSNDLRERLASKKSSSGRADSKVSTTADSHTESHGTST
mmetsp:Transcript_62027/g.115116  ORF Transcript_62027/g.115116 Transcript_62027/m.115116 type:complete len:380 (+) Transcript_62027:52-1191(+)